MTASALASYLRQGPGRPNPPAAPAERGARGLLALARSAAMARVLAELETFARTEFPVLITGETGSGKELVARALHELSGRAGGRMVSLNVAAVPASLLESELFGHVRGAFTGAAAPRDGLFRSAAGGTLFLDEIGEAPGHVQAALLRVLESRLVRPVGSDREIAADARVVAATHRDLGAMAARGAFRRDLLYRISVLSLRVPPLRERTEDIAGLAEVFFERHAGQLGPRRLTPAALASLARHPWPGNVRELQSCLARAALLSRGERVDVGAVDDVLAGRSAPPPVRPAPPAQTARPAAPGLPVEIREEDLRRLMAEEAGNITRVAARLNVARSTVRAHLARAGIAETDQEPEPPAS